MGRSYWIKIWIFASLTQGSALMFKKFRATLHNVAMYSWAGLFLGKSEVRDFVIRSFLFSPLMVLLSSPRYLYQFESFWHQISKNLHHNGLQVWGNTSNETKSVSQSWRLFDLSAHLLSQRQQLPWMSCDLRLVSTGHQNSCSSSNLYLPSWGNWKVEGKAVFLVSPF